MPKVDSPVKSRYWVFVTYNVNAVIDCSALAHLRYCIYQKQLDTDGITEVILGYVELKATQRKSYIRKWLSAHENVSIKALVADLKKRDGYRAACQSETGLAPPVEFGEFEVLKPGTRTDMQELKTAIDSGANLLKIYEEHVDQFMKYNRSIQNAIALKTKPRDWKTKVTVLVGPTGTGKSKWVYDNYPAPQVYPKQRSNWWDAYLTQEIVLIDDFYGWLPYDEMLRLCDRYPMLVQTKGGQAQFLAKEIIITSNRRPTHWYKPEVTKDFSAFIRRVERWVIVPELNQFIETDNYQHFVEACDDHDFDCDEE